jgi:hypothetical protein
MSDTGRYYVKVNGRTFCVEPIDNTLGNGRKKWGDIDPATKKVTGSYGDKNIGAIHEDESIITKENGYDEIYELEPGVSPDSFINELIKKESIKI